MISPKNSTIGVIGSGRMGTDIAYFLHDLNFDLVWICINEEEKSRLVQFHDKKMRRLIRYGLRCTDEIDQNKNTLMISCSLRDLYSCDIIIEAINEDVSAKERLFMELNTVIRNTAIVVTNTSSIRPSRLIEDISLKRRFAGLHFFYPAKLKKSVELILTEYTNDHTIAVLRDFIGAMGKVPLEMPEEEGFVLNRIFLDFQALAVRLYRDGTADLKAIDHIIKKSIFPHGVFEFFDNVGIDVMYQSVINYTGPMENRDFYEPFIDFLEGLLARNRLGRKCGSGCYDYPVDGEPGEFPDEQIQDELTALLRALYVNSVFKMVEKNICSVDDLECAVKEYMDLDHGPVELARTIGHGAVRDILTRHYYKTGFEAYRPSSLL